MAAKAITVFALDPLVIPDVQEPCRHRVVMDGEEKIGRPLVRALHARYQAGKSRTAVTRTRVLRKPAAPNSLSMALASFRLNSYSGTPRALIAPGISAVWPTSTRIRNLLRSHFT